MLTAIMEQLRLFGTWLTTEIDFSGKQKKEQAISKVMDTLKTCDVGITCNEFTAVTIAGPPRKELPPFLAERMHQHEQACVFHQSPAFHHSATKVIVTEENKKSAQDIIEKYRKLNELIPLKG